MPNRYVLPSTLLAAIALAACSDANHGTPVGAGGDDSQAQIPATGQGTEQQPSLQFGDDSGAQTVDPTNDDPFSMPDPAGATRLERLGFRAVADQAQALVTVRYADPYLSVADALRDLVSNEALVTGSRAVNCPNGGSASISRANAGAPGQPLARNYTFEACTVDGTTLSGSLRQRETRSGKQLATLTELASTAEGLSITGEDGSRATVTGTLVTRVARTLMPDCGAEPAVQRTREIAFDSVTLEGSDDLIGDVFYRYTDVDGYDESGDCTSIRATSFEGESTAQLEDGAGGLVEVSLSTQGILYPESPEESDATLTALAADGSRLNVTATDSGAGLAQFDLISGDVVSATVDSFRFVP